MNNRKRLLRPQSAVAVLGTMVLLSLGATTAHAGNIFGVDVADYIVMYEGGGSNSLNVNNFGGGVQTTMNNLNSLSSTFGSLAASGTALTINTSAAGGQTVLASSGALVGGARLFNVTSVNSGNGKNLFIKGDGSTGVVIDVNTPGDAQFHGNVLLRDLTGKLFGEAGYAGLFPDQVLFNLYAGTGLTGGDKLDANNNGNAAHPANIIYGTFLNPNGAISFVNTRTVGRISGGNR